MDLIQEGHSYYIKCLQRVYLLYIFVTSHSLRYKLGTLICPKPISPVISSLLGILAVKDLAEHSFQVSMPNSPLLI